MQLRHMKTVQPAAEGEKVMQRVTALCWAPNNMRLAAVTTDRIVHLFDENGERRDKFSTKPADPKGRKKGMVVDCDGVVISVQETTTKYALRKLWRGVPVQRAYVYCVKTAGGVYATAAETALRRSLDDVAPPVARPSPSDVVVGKEPI